MLHEGRKNKKKNIQLLSTISHTHPNRQCIRVLKKKYNITSATRLIILISQFCHKSKCFIYTRSYQLCGLFYNPCNRDTLLTTSVLLAQIRKPPDIAKTHAVPDNTEKELHFPTPCRPVLLLRLLATGGILASCCYDRHVMGGLATVV